MTSSTSPRAHRPPPLGVRLALVALVALATLAGAGKADAAPCWKVLINDWFPDARIDKTYPPACFREAIKHLPRDVKDYASAEEDINRALQQQLLRKTRTRARGETRTLPPDTRGGGGTTGSAGVPATGGGTTGGSGTGATTGRRPQPPTTTAEPPDRTETTVPPSAGNDDDDLLGQIGPDNADAVPLPLLILAGIALLLLAAAAVSLVARRVQERRIPGAPRPPDPPLQ